MIHSKFLRKIHPGAMVKCCKETASSSFVNKTPDKFLKVVKAQEHYVHTLATDDYFCCRHEGVPVLCFYYKHIKEAKLFLSNPELVKENHEQIKQQN